MMFTGLVESLGTVTHKETNASGAIMQFQPHLNFDDIKIGDSIAVNGLCLTATHLINGAFQADVSHESLRRSNLGTLSIGDYVNLERAMASQGRFGGHMVSGHIDDIGEITKIEPDGAVRLIDIHLPAYCRRWTIEKGSITVDGISLTIVSTTLDGIQLAIIPHSLQATTLTYAQPGQQVNIECDLVAKYIDHFIHLGPASAKASVDEENKLRELIEWL